MSAIGLCRAQGHAELAVAARCRRAQHGAIGRFDGDGGAWLGRAGGGGAAGHHAGRSSRGRGVSCWRGGSAATTAARSSRTHTRSGGTGHQRVETRDGEQTGRATRCTQHLAHRQTTVGQVDGQASRIGIGRNVFIELTVFHAPIQATVVVGEHGVVVVALNDEVSFCVVFQRDMKVFANAFAADFFRPRVFGRWVLKLIACAWHRFDAGGRFRIAASLHHLDCFTGLLIACDDEHLDVFGHGESLFELCVPQGTVGNRELMAARMAPDSGLTQRGSAHL